MIMQRTMAAVAAVLPVVLLPLALVVALATRALASDGTMPWDDLIISFGGTALVWGGVVAGVIQIGKAIQLHGKPLLGSPQAIWLANLALGGPGMFLYAYLDGAGILPSLLQAVLAVLGASGAYEAVATVVGKGSPQNSPS